MSPPACEGPHAPGSVPPAVAAVRPLGSAALVHVCADHLRDTQRRPAFAQWAERHAAALAWVPWRYQGAPEGATGAMLRAYRRAFACTQAGGTVQMHWCGADLDADGFRREFRAALDRRIDAKSGPPRPWRRLDALWQTECARDARAANDYASKRIRGGGMTLPENRRRLPRIDAALRDRSE